MTATYRPEYDNDEEYGEDGERIAREVLGWTLTRSPRVEVKRKRRLDDWLYVELLQDPGATGRCWKQSGLNITTADLWAYVVADSGVLLYFPTDLLRWAIRTDAGKPCAETDGDNPTEGRLLRVSWLIQATEQWKAA